jgi:hypothetical protein
MSLEQNTVLRINPDQTKVAFSSRMYDTKDGKQQPQYQYEEPGYAGDPDKDRAYEMAQAMGRAAKDQHQKMVTAWSRALKDQTDNPAADGWSSVKGDREMNQKLG